MNIVYLYLAYQICKRSLLESNFLNGLQCRAYEDFSGPKEIINLGSLPARISETTTQTDNCE
jgi:hypothetical protein